jgi:hypothetical protein
LVTIGVDSRSMVAFEMAFEMAFETVKPPDW